MKRPLFAILLCAPLLLAAAKTDRLAPIPPQDKTILEPAIKRYAIDQMKLDWNDLFEIDEQDVPTKRELLLKDDAPPVSKSDYVRL